jgi:predicted nucleotidyltransferase component of viral defense system
VRVSRERLAAAAKATGFRQEILEKVFQLLNLLQSFGGHPFLKNRLALKGGTALNLFLFNLPRLSVDIDLNYVSAVDRETMLRERPQVEKAIQAVCSREEVTVTRVPTDHAGGKWRLRYDSALGEGGNLEVDLNFMYRAPLWPLRMLDSKPIAQNGAQQIPVLDLHELAAGKLAALFARQASRDLFDAHRLLTQASLNPKKLRLGFVLYGAMNRIDWRTVTADNITCNFKQLEQELIPVVRAEVMTQMKAEDWAERLVAECQAELGRVLPFNDAEMEFLDRILDHGEIHPDLLTDDADMAQRIAAQPLLNWKALNVRKHRRT